MPFFHVIVAPRVQPTDLPQATHRLYFLRGQSLSRAHAERISREILADPVTEAWSIDQPSRAADGHFIKITFLPGVTDSVPDIGKTP